LTEKIWNGEEKKEENVRDKGIKRGKGKEKIVKWVKEMQNREN
jgi:hypothetical protein